MVSVGQIIDTPELMEAYREGQRKCERNGGDPTKRELVNSYKVGSEQAEAFRIGWNEYWNPVWDKEMEISQKSEQQSDISY